MELSTFKKRLHTALLERGIPEDKAATGVAGVTRNLTEERKKAIEKISSDADFMRFADSVADRIKHQINAGAPKRSKSNAPADIALTTEMPTRAEMKRSPTVPSPSAETVKNRDNATAEFAPLKRAYVAPKAKAAPAATNPPKPKHELDEDEAIETARPKPRFAGKKTNPDTIRYSDPSGERTFKLVLLCGIPLWIIGAAALVMFFGACYAAVIGLIVMCLAAMILVVTSGVGVSLIGLIYGGIKLFTVLPEGLYEMGLAAIICGCTMLISIILYNLGIRFLPLLFAPLKSFVLFTVDKIIDLYYYIKKECYKR